MKALILAAGRGSRMGAETQEQPKCLTELAGRPLIDWQKDALLCGGADEVGAIGGYLSDMLRPHLEVPYLNTRWGETNMVATLACAAECLETAETLISYGDIVYHPDAVKALAAAQYPIAITYDEAWLALWQKRFPDPLEDAETFRVGDRGELVEIGARPTGLEDVQGQYMGLLKFKPEGWSQVEKVLKALPDDERDRLDMTGLLRRLIAQGVTIGAVPVRGRWCEVDHPSDRRLYEERIAEVDASGVAWSHDWRWT